MLNLLEVSVIICFLFNRFYLPKKITLINIYGPNNDTRLFYNKVSDETVEYLNNQSIILIEDYNLVQNQRLDTYSYVGINNSKAKDKVLDIIEIYNFTDPFRELYPDLKRYTWRKLL